MLDAALDPGLRQEETVADAFTTPSPRQRMRAQSPVSADPGLRQQEIAANVQCFKRLRTKSPAPVSAGVRFSAASASGVEGPAAPPRTQAQQLTLRGLDIQYPFSRLIMSGAKTIEARSYALGHRGIAQAGEKMFLIETPGSKSASLAVVGDLSIGAPPDHAQVIGTVSFNSSSEYTCLSAWRNDRRKHRIQEGSQYDWNGTGKMHAWCIGHVQGFSQPVAAGSKSQVGYSTPRTLEVTGLLANGSSEQIAGSRSPGLCPSSATDLRSRRYDLGFWEQLGGHRIWEEEDGDVLEQTRLDNQRDLERCRALLLEMTEEDLQGILMRSWYNHSSSATEHNAAIHAHKAVDDQWLDEAAAAYRVPITCRKVSAHGRVRNTSRRRAEVVNDVIVAVRKARHCLRGAAADRKKHELMEAINDLLWSCPEHLCIAVASEIGAQHGRRRRDSRTPAHFG